MLKSGVNCLLPFILFWFILVMPPQVLATHVCIVVTMASDTLSPELLLWFVLIFSLIVLILVMIFYSDKLRIRLSRGEDASWMKLSYSHIETGENIIVGEWLDEVKGDRRIITFKPSRPMLEDESGLMDWLDAYLSEYGNVTFSENGEIKVTCSDEILPDRLLEQVSWVFYTLQMTS